MSDIKKFSLKFNATGTKSNQTYKMVIEALDVFSAMKKAKEKINEEKGDYKIITYAEIDIVE